jgi:hypothetical protein
MRDTKRLLLAIAGLVCLVALLAPAAVLTQDKPTVKIPDPGVPQIMSIEGNFVRAAYNNEGYVILGYQVANRSVGDEWMLLEVGMTVMQGVKNQTLTRDALSLDTPDGKTLPLPTIPEYRQTDTRALQNRAKVQRDSINYFPPMASQPCRIGFFSDVGQAAMAYDQVELSYTRACLGRLFFHIPGGIAYGQYWLNVKLAGGVIRVPFKVFTKEEEKLLSKNYKSIKKQVDDAFKKKSKT